MLLRWRKAISLSTFEVYCGNSMKSAGDEPCVGAKIGETSEMIKESKVYELSS